MVARQGARNGKMVMGSMCDISLLRPVNPEIEKRVVKRNRDVKAIYIKICRKYIFDNDWEMVKNCIITNWDYDKKTQSKLKKLYNRLHRST